MKAPSTVRRWHEPAATNQHARRRHGVVFLLDVDDTLLDDERVQRDFRAYLRRAIGRRHADEYWRLLEARRHRFGFADYLGALQSYRRRHRHQPHVLAVSSFLLDYPFAERLMPGARNVLARLRKHGETVIVSDGDVVFQPHKIESSGLRDAVQGRVLVYIHKHRELRDVERRHPARHYVVIDDNAEILARMKSFWKDRVTTVLRGARRAARGTTSPDVVIREIRELMRLPLQELAPRSSRQPPR